jgi:hypothetical protein
MKRQRVQPPGFRFEQAVLPFTAKHGASVTPKNAVRFARSHQFEGTAAVDR